MNGVVFLAVGYYATVTGIALLVTFWVLRLRSLMPWAIAYNAAANCICAIGDALSRDWLWTWIRIVFTLIALGILAELAMKGLRRQDQRAG